MKLSVSQMKKYILNKKTAALVVILLLGVGYIVFRSNNQVSNTTGQNIAQAQVTRGPLMVTVTGTGTIVPIAEENIGPNVSGTVNKIYVQNGDRVKKGDLLLELTSDSLSLQLEKARLDVEKARLTLNDSTNLLSQDTIVAPFSGRIFALDAKTGDDAAKNSVLATLQDDSQLVFDMPVDSTVAGKVAINQKIEVFLPDRGESVEGKVLAKNSQPVSGYNGSSRTYLKVAVAGTGNLTSGTKAFGTVTVEGKQVDALSVSNLEWMGEAQLKATLSGKITGVYVQEGQVVKKGQKLFTLSSDTALSQKQTQQLAYQQAQLNVLELQTQQNALTVKATMDGTVSGMNLKAGDELTASGTKSTQSSSTATASTVEPGKIISTGQMLASFPVDEVDIAKVKPGQKANISVDALPDKAVQGTVKEISEEGTVTNNVSSFQVTILIDNPDNLLKSGMTANVTIAVARKDNVLRVPIEALQENGRRKTVLVPASGNTGAQTRQQVSVGLTNESFAEITEGLQEGDTILIPGQQASSSRPNTMIPGFGGGRPSGGGGGRTSGSGSGR